MKSSKLPLVLLAVFIVLPFFAFGAGQKDAGATTEPMPILFMAGTNDAKMMADNQYVQLTLEKKFNVKLSFSPAPWYNEPDKFMAIVAAGQLPDCGWTCLTKKAPDLYAQGVIRSVPVAIAEKFAPNYMKRMADRPLMKAWQSLSETEYYAFYQIQGVRSGGTFATALRLDWMENLGIKPKGNVTRLVPEGTTVTDGADDKGKSVNSRLFVTDYQYDYNDFVSILEAFVKNDPDRNGKADTYGLSDAILEWMDGYWSFHIFPVDGMNFRWVREPDNSAAPQQYSKAFKANLEMHKALADRGLLTPDYVTAQYDQCWAWWSTGKAGAIGVVEGYIGAATIPPLSIAYDNPDAKILLIPPTQGRRGMVSDFMGGSDIGEFFFNKKLTDAKFQKCLEMFDWMYATDEGIMFCQYGTKDVNYKLNDKGKVDVEASKAMNVALPPEKRVAVGSDIWCNGQMMSGQTSWATQPWDLNTRVGLLYQYDKQHWPRGEGYYVFFGLGSAALNDMAFMKAENQEAKDKAYRQYVTDLCGGTTDANTAYQKMMSVLDGMGYQEYLKAVQTRMYIVEELEKGKSVTPSQVIKK